MPAPVPFGVRLATARADSGLLCVGIDPHASELASWSLPDSAAGAREYALRMIEAVAGRVAVVKPQSAFFERHGAAGVAVLEDVLAAARDVDLLVLLDVKRGDIGSTTAAYAQAYLDVSSPLAADAITVSPFLGVGALEPVFTTAAANGAGVFVLAMTSNPEGRLVTGRDDSSAGRDGGGARARRAAGVQPVSPGARSVRWSERRSARRRRTCRSGGRCSLRGSVRRARGSRDLPAVFGAAMPDVLPSASRSVSQAGPDVGELRSVVARYEAELRAVLG